MEFSRLDQFQAVLVGMAMADAVAHGQIATGCPLGNPPMPPASISWRHAVVDVARHLRSNHSDSAAVDVAVRDDSDIAQVMVHLPIVLRYIDDAVEPCFEIAEQLGLPTRNPVLITQLYGLLQTLLSQAQDQSLSMRLQALEACLAALPPQAEAANQALMYVVQAAGDFRLAISLSVGAKSRLPVLVGMMCTALRGLPTIPVAWRRALAQTTWYADHWGLADEIALRNIATDLWRAWAGL